MLQSHDGRGRFAPTIFRSAHVSVWQLLNHSLHLAEWCQLFPKSYTLGTNKWNIFIPAKWRQKSTKLRLYINTQKMKSLDYLSEVRYMKSLHQQNWNPYPHKSCWLRHHKYKYLMTLKVTTSDPKYDRFRKMMSKDSPNQVFRPVKWSFCSWKR